MAIHYVIHASDDHRINIHKEKINLGVNRLWFYDGEDNLLAVFQSDDVKRVLGGGHCVRPGCNRRPSP